MILRAFVVVLLALSGTELACEVRRPDVTPITVGIETRDGSFTPIIQRSTSIPVRKTRVFTTVIDNQERVEVHVLQGESVRAEQNESLAKFQVNNIPPAPKGVPKIEVTFEVDISGTLHISAKEEATGYAVDRVIRHWASATPRRIDRTTGR